MPLDAEYPKERLAFILRDCAIQLVVAEQKLLGRLATGCINTLRTICLEQETVQIAGANDQDLQLARTAQPRLTLFIRRDRPDIPKA